MFNRSNWLCCPLGCFLKCNSGYIELLKIKYVDHSFWTHTVIILKLVCSISDSYGFGTKKAVKYNHPYWWYYIWIHLWSSNDMIYFLFSSWKRELKLLLLLL